jgi:hypothetical protein
LPATIFAAIIITPRHRLAILIVARFPSRLSRYSDCFRPLSWAFKMSTAVWIYVDTSKQVGDVDHLKVFASKDAAERWFAENDPEGVAFEYPVLK